MFGAIANTDYEGEIKGMGDNVVIRTVPTITINTYQIGQGLTYQRPASDAIDLSIDQGKYWGFQLNSVEKIQSDLDLMNEWSREAGEQMAVAIDEDILAYVFTEAHADNAGTTAGAKSGAINLGNNTTPLSVNSANIIESILKCGLVLDEQNVPQEGRWIVIPSWAAMKLKLSDLKDASITGDSVSPMRNGRLGMIDRFTVYVSNQLNETEATEVDVVAGHKRGLTFAAQITEMEDLPNPSDFGRLVRGLTVYGRKVTKPEMIVHSVWKQAAEA